MVRGIVRVGVVVAAVVCLAREAAPQDAARADGWVVMGIDEYRALRARAFPSAPDPAPPPLDAALTRVDYDLRVSGETVTGQARLAIDVLKQGWASVQVPAGMLVRDARVDGRATPLSAADGGPARVLIARAGRSVLTLDVVVPLASAAGSESITLPASGSALSAVTLLVPRTGVDLAVSGGFIAEQSETGSDSRWVVYGNPGRPLAFTWKRKSDDRRSTQPLRTRAAVTELVALGEDSTQVTSSVHLEVTQGLAREVLIALPAGLVVNQVAGAEVADWTVAGTTLSVTFLEPIAAQTSVVISGEVRAPRDGQITIPLVRVPSPDRETGGVAVDDRGRRRDRRTRAARTRTGRRVRPRRHRRRPRSRRRWSPSGSRRSPAARASLTVNVSRLHAQAVLVANVEEARYDALLGEGRQALDPRALRRPQQPAGSLALRCRRSHAGAPRSPASRSVRVWRRMEACCSRCARGAHTSSAPTFVVELLYLQRGPGWTERGPHGWRCRRSICRYRAPA